MQFGHVFVSHNHRELAFEVRSQQSASLLQQSAADGDVIAASSQINTHDLWVCGVIKHERQP